MNGCRIGRALAWAALLLAAVARGQTPVYYVHSGIVGSGAWSVTGADVAAGVGASDANEGTDPAAPLRSLGPSGLGGKSPPFVAYLAGRFYTEDQRAFAFLMESASGVELRQWPGQTQAQIKMSNKIGGGWTDLGGGVYSKVCDGSPDLRGANVSAVCIDYEWTGNIDGEGRHRCFVPLVGSAADAAGAANTAQGGVFVDWSTGVVTLGLPLGQASPNSARANGVEYVVAGRSGIGFLASDLEPANTGLVVDGLRIGPCCGAGVAPLGCGIAVTNTRGFVISNNTITDHGVHALSIGLGCEDDTTRGNTAIGMSEGGISYVWDAFGVGHQATNCKSYADRSYVNGLLGCDGKGIARYTRIGGFYVHGQVHDIEYVNCQTFEYEGNEPMDAVSPASFAQEDSEASQTPLVTPTDPEDPETYPIRWRRTIPGELGFNAGTCFPGQGVRSYVAFINERFDGRNFGRRSNGAYVDLRLATGGRWAFFGCEGVLRMDGARDMAAFGVGERSEVLLVNSSFYDASTVHGPYRFGLVNYFGPGTFTAVGSLWGFLSGDTGTCMVGFGDLTVGAERHLFSGCELWNIGAGDYSENPEFSSAELWGERVDIGAVAAGENPFSDPGGASGLGLATLEQARLGRRSPHAPLGVNGEAYAGNLGAYQYPDGQCAGSLSVSPASASFCPLTSATFDATAAGAAVGSSRWIWRATVASPWRFVDDGANIGPDGLSWFHALGAEAAGVTITYEAGDFASSDRVDLACVGTTACATLTSGPAAVYLMNPPAIQPPAQLNIAACASQAVALTAGVWSLPGLSVTYRWQLRDPEDGSWSDLSDGEVVRGGAVVGEAEGTLTGRMLYRLYSVAYGTVRVLVTNECGVSASQPITIRFNSADFNGDGDVGTDADIEAFFACMAGNCCAACESADFNGDGDVGTDQDILTFFQVLASGSC